MPELFPRILFSNLDVLFRETALLHHFVSLVEESLTSVVVPIAFLENRLRLCLVDEILVEQFYCWQLHYHSVATSGEPSRFSLAQVDAQAQSTLVYTY